jgi:hypothetical protein
MSSRQYSAGMRPRRFISDAVDAPTPIARAKAELPPKTEIMSEIDISIEFDMAANVRIT